MSKLTSRKNLQTLGLVASTSAALAGLLAVSCGDEGSTTVYEGDTHNYYNLGGSGPTGGAASSGGDSAQGGGGGEGPEEPEAYTSHLPTCGTKSELGELDIDLFGEDGHLFYFEVTPLMRRAGDEQACRLNGNGVYGLENPPCPLAADNVRIVPAGGGTCADTGKIELELVGQSSFKSWLQIPNFKLDVGEFIDQKFSSGDKNLRMNNGQADSTILRESVALRVFRALGYPAPQTSFVKTQSNVWDSELEPGVFAAHVMVRPYKKAFFKAELPSAVHVWEGGGDPFGADGWFEVECEWTDGDDCDDSALASIVHEVRETPEGPGFMASTAHLIDWPTVHDNQCIAALTGTGDDWIHNNNNVVLVLRDDGRIMYLPYSTDISGGHPWYRTVPYDGNAHLATQCMLDPECRTAALDTCDALINEFDALDVPENIVAERCATLEGLGLMRGPDADVCDQLTSFYKKRGHELRLELERLREDLGTGGMGGGSAGGASPL